jgi:hypothetical protein
MKVLVTGGAVHAHLDSIKIITNGFRGGRMLQLALQLQDMAGVEVTYLTASHLKRDVLDQISDLSPKWRKPKIVMHNGFLEYEDYVCSYAHEFDAVVLGAAVANLIPVRGEQSLLPERGKFPSHNYKPGEVINIPFMIAPRVIDQVRKRAPKTKIFGFKLLDGVPEEELVEAAYDIVLASSAVAVFANDKKNLDLKLAVTKERSVIPIDLSGPNPESLAVFIQRATEDEYYHTEQVDAPKALVPGFADHIPALDAALARCVKMLKLYGDRFTKTYGKEKYIFGTVASRVLGSPISFVTTARGKKTTGEFTHVVKVDHEERCVHVVGPKASLNAPLLHWLFKHNDRLQTIVHFHEPGTTGLEVLPWYPPGTVRDSQRNMGYRHESFEIEHHGVFLLFEDGKDEYLG